MPEYRDSMRAGPFCLNISDTWKITAKIERCSQHQAAMPGSIALLFGWRFRTVVNLDNGSKVEGESMVFEDSPDILHTVVLYFTMLGPSKVLDRRHAKKARWS